MTDERTPEPLKLLDRYAEKTRLPVPGEELPNGRTLVAIRLVHRKQQDWAGDMYSVLCLTGHGGDTYVVWTFMHKLDGSESYCYGGTYTDDFDRALEVWRSKTWPPR